MKSRHLPISLFSTTLVSTCLLLLLAVPGHAQFDRVFGTALDESFAQVIPSGSSYYVLGSGEVTAGQPRRATVTRLDAAGALVWTLSLNTASAWTAAVLTPAGNLLVVGHTLPAGANSKSIMGSVTATGTFAWVRSYDNPGNDAFLKIVKNPAPQHPGFPYYVLGSQTDAMTMNTDMVLLNVDDSGNINFEKLYTGPLFFSGNKYARDLEALPNGDLLIAANLETQGILMRTNNAGEPFAGATPEFPFSITDLAQGDGGDIYAVGKASQNSQVHLMKFDADLIGLWDYTISGAAEVSQVLHAAANGDLYLSGKKAMTFEPCVFRLTENDGTPELVDVKLLNGNATSQTGGTLSLLSDNQLAFADSRSIPIVGFGGGCAFVAVTDLDLSSCVARDGADVLEPTSTLFNGPLLPEANFYEVPEGVNLTGSLRTWQQGDACSSSLPCAADFTFEFPNCDPSVSFTNTSTGPAPLSYSWNFGLTVLGIPQTSVATNPFYTYPAQCGTYNVCLTVNGADCSNTLCKTVVIKYPQSPVFSCPPDITVACNTSTGPATTGFATLTGACSGFAPNITYVDVVSGTMPCNATIDRTWSVTDECGQAHTCVQTITVIDNIPPGLTNCPQDITVTGITGSNGICTANVYVTSPSTSDNCDLSVDLVNSFNNTANASGTYPSGTTSVTWTATDDCGNTATCAFSVTVNCGTAICCPEFSLVQLDSITPCPGDITCRGDSAVHIPNGLEIRRRIACKNSLQSYYVVPNLPGFSYTWSVTGGTPASLTGNPGVITWGSGSQGYLQVIVTDASGTCRDTLTQEICLLDSPTAAFLVAPGAIICSNQLVNFSNTSSGGNIYYWDFGDGTSSTAEHPPAHSYPLPGTYTVVLTVSNGATEFMETPCGCTDTATAIITVLADTGPTITSLNCKEMLCPRDTITYFVSPGCAPYNWTVNGGTIIANNGSTITVDWNQSAPATFPGSVSVTTGCGGVCGNSATLNVPVLWDNIPINGPNSVCVGTTATYSLPAMPGTFYTWNVSGAGGVIISPNLNTPSITVDWGNAPGIGTISCSYSNPFSGCDGDTTLVVNVKNKFTISGPSQVCEGVPGNVYLVTSGGTATWTVSSGTAGTDYTISSTTGVLTAVNWLTPGSYTVMATPLSPGPTAFCNPSATVTVVVNPAPVLNTISGPLVVCPNQLYDYTASSTLSGGDFVWSFSGPGTGTISPYGPNNESASVSFTGTGPWTLQVTQRVNDCPGTTSLTITREPLPMLPPAPRTACIGGKTTVTVLPGSNGPYTWSTSPAVSLVSGQGTTTAMYEIHATGTITVANCSGTSNIINVTKTNPPPTNITKTGSLCLGNLQLTATPTSGIVTSYQWFGPSSSTSQVINVTKPGTYTIQIMFQDGCISVATYTVIPEVVPTVAISTGDPLGWCLTTTPAVTLQAYSPSSGCSYQWYKYNSSNPVGTNSPTYTATSAGSYYVVVTCNGCIATSNVITVIQYDCTGGGGGCVGVNPFSAISEVQGNPITACNPKTFTVNVGVGCSSNTVLWSFGDGSPNVVGTYTSAGVNSVTHTYATPGTYLVRSIINCNNCTFTETIKVYVPLVADFLYSVQCGANGANTVTLINASQTLGDWNVTGVNWTTSCGTPTTPSTGDTYIFNTTSNCNPTVMLTMTVTDPASGKVCIDSKSFTFNFATVPLTITGPQVVCKDQIYAYNYVLNGPNILQYEWTVGGVAVSQEPTLQYAFGGSPTNPQIGLTLTDDLGCTYTATLPVTVVTPRPLTLAPLAICQDCLPPATLSATPATGFTNYQWYQNGIPVGSSTATYQLCQFNAAGNYYVTANDSQNNNCLVKSNTVPVVYHPKPKAKIEGETVQCRSGNGPYSIALANAGGPNSNYLFNWTATPAGSVTFSPNTLYDANATVTQPGEYQFVLTVTDIHTGCMAKDTFCVIVYLNPMVTVSGPAGILCAGTPYTFTASASPPGNYVYVWNNGVTGATMTTSQAGFYTVTATNEESGCSGTNNNLFHIRETPSTILFPVGCDTICDTGTITPPLVPNPGYVVQWFVNGVSTSFFTGLTLNLTGNVVPPLVYGFNDIYIVVSCQGCSDTSNVYNLFISPCCVCKSELALFHGNEEYPVSCDPRVGFIPSFGCPAEDVTVFGYFGFADPLTGEPCEETEVFWELVMPDLTTQGGITTNFTSFTFLKDSIADPGLYCLNLMTISADGLDTCVCKVTWIREPCVCCASEEEFCENLENNVTLSIDQQLCTATLDIGGFDGCDGYIEWIDWNYPSTQQGPYPPGSSVTYNYSGSGTYTICYLAIERDTATGINCNEKLVCETITLDCADCYCGTFSSLFFPLNRDVQGSSAFCDAPEITLGCPAPGRSIQLTGSFQCAGPNCPATAQVSWQLYRLPNTTTPVASSTTTANPYFSISILPAWYATPGSYELRLVGHCGVQECPCIVRFRVDCPDPCPCDEAAFMKAVKKGFASVTSNLACQACFAPVALSDCDSVSWHIGSISNPPVGATFGNQTFCQNFASSGTYTIVMSVIRKKSDGTVCAMAVKSRTVQVTCTPFPICDASVFDNPGFNLGAEGGVLGSGGLSENWMAASGEPVVIEGAGGSLNAWTISLAGNLEGGDALTPLDPICLERDTGMITLRAKDMTSGGRPRPCDRIVVGLGRDGMLDDALTLATISLDALDWGEWYDIQIPYDLEDYPEVDACGNAMQGALVQPVVYVTNALVDEQGGVDTRSSAQIDYFCFGGRLLTKVDDPKQGPSIHFFPNPTTGELTLRFDGATPSQGQLQILDLYGRVVQQQPLVAGTAEQILSIEALPAGVYFVKVLDEGIPVWAGKVIKQ